MNAESMLQRRQRIHAIVEGALLGDIAVVFLWIRVYLPVPPVRQLISVLAAVSIVMLTQRRGLRIAILSTIASYILFSGLVGPLLAIAALNVGLAGILAGMGRKAGWHPAINVIWAGMVYAVLDLIVPTIGSIFVFRYPVKDLIHSARNFVKLVFDFIQFGVSHGWDQSLRPLSLGMAIFLAIVALRQPTRRAAMLTALSILPFLAISGFLYLGGPTSTSSTIHQLKVWERVTADNWVLPWLGITFLYGFLQMYLVVLVSNMVLNQVPEQTLERQRVAS
jgi:Predicted membrane protein (DUF2232)